MKSDDKLENLSSREFVVYWLQELKWRELVWQVTCTNIQYLYSYRSICTTWFNFSSLKIYPKHLCFKHLWKKQNVLTMCVQFLLQTIFRQQSEWDTNYGERAWHSQKRRRGRRPVPSKGKLNFNLDRFASSPP